MKKQLIVFFLLISSSTFAQHFRFEPVLGFVNFQQHGQIYIPSSHSPTLPHSTVSIDRNYSRFNIGVTCWYSLNFGSALFESVAYGIESGVNFTTGSLRLSIEPQRMNGLNIRLPLMFGVRTGAAIDNKSGRFGAGLSAGFELFKTAIADETGIYVMPKVSFMLGTKVLLGVHLFPFRMKSVYLVDGSEYDRITTAMIEFSLRTGISWYPKD